MSTNNEGPCPLYGLVLIGGESRRMKAIKAEIEYHGKPQVQHCFELLEPLCEGVYVSSRSDQEDLPCQRSLPQIHDVHPGVGPMGGILAAMARHPEGAWCILACDMPFVDKHTLQSLVKGRNPAKLATVFENEVDGLPEPLCAIYEPRASEFLDEARRAETYSLRKVLAAADLEIIEPPHGLALTNVNSWDAYQETLSMLRKEGGDGP